MEKHYYTHKRIADHVAHILSRNEFTTEVVQVDSEWCLSTDAPRRTVIYAATIAAKHRDNPINM